MDYLGDFSSGNNNFVASGGTLHFKVEELLDFSDDKFLDVPTAKYPDTSSLTPVGSSNSSVGDSHFDLKSFEESQFPGNVPFIQEYDADLEWLSNFVEESFSTHNLRFIPTTSAAVNPTYLVPPPVFPTDVSVPGKARSKRSRPPPCDWSSRLLHVTAKQAAAETRTTVRKCLHCASEKTPQWRTGPMGPKTLCNACGVRYKSGRLVQEYRPAASPTFIASKHSNSHRKVLEMRRQKEAQRQQEFIGQVSMFEGCDELLIHHPNNLVLNGHDLRRVM